MFYNCFTLTQVFSSEIRKLFKNTYFEEHLQTSWFNIWFWYLIYWFTVAFIANNTTKFKWKSKIIENLIKCLQNYKTMMCYKSKDFDTDWPSQCRFIREAMACIYSSDTKKDEHFFGPEKPYEMLLHGGEELSSEVLAAEKLKEKETKEHQTRLPKNFRKNKRNSSKSFNCHYDWYQIR